MNKPKTPLSVFQPTKFAWVSPTERLPEWTGQYLVWTSEGLEVLRVEERAIEYADGTPADWREITAWAEVEKPSPTHLVIKANLEYKSTDWVLWPAGVQRIEVHGDGWVGYPYTEGKRTFVLHRPDFLVLFQCIEEQRTRCLRGEIPWSLLQALYDGVLRLTTDKSRNLPNERLAPESLHNWFHGVLRKLEPLYIIENV